MFLRILYPFEGIVDSRTVIHEATKVVGAGDGPTFDGRDLARAIEIMEDAGLYTFTARTVERAAGHVATVERV